jgi:hypothetical protein
MDLKLDIIRTVGTEKVKCAGELYNFLLLNYNYAHYV